MEQDNSTVRLPRTISVERRLDFLVSFMGAVGINCEDVARILGYATVRSINSWFKVDNCPLAQVYALADKTGYSFNVTLSKKRLTPQNPQKVGVQDVMVNDGTFILKRTSFISIACREAGVTKEELARRLGVSATALYRWIQIDDVKVMVAYEIAEALGLDIYFNFTPKASTVQDVAEERKVVTSILTFKKVAVGVTPPASRRKR